MLKAVFLSDLHLTTLDDLRGQTFLKLLSSWGGPASSAPITHLFLVGDIFDLWLADHDYFLRRYQPVIGQIQRLRLQGVEVHYFEGNHDLYLDPFWREQLRVQVHRGPASLKLGPWKVRVEHGDQMDPDDRGYRFLRWLLRTGPVSWLGHHLPSRVAVGLGERASRSSRAYTSEVKTVSREDAIVKMRRHADLIAAGEDFDLLVHGHVHVRDDYVFSVGGRERRSINLGSWLGGDFGYLELTEKGAVFQLAP